MILQWEHGVLTTRHSGSPFILLRFASLPPISYLWNSLAACWRLSFYVEKLFFSPSHPIRQFAGASPRPPVRILSSTDNSGLSLGYTRDGVDAGIQLMDDLALGLGEGPSTPFCYFRKWTSHEPEPKVSVRTLASCRG